MLYTLTANEVTLPRPVSLAEAINLYALPVDETATDIEEMTFRTAGGTVTLTRCEEPEPPQTAQVLLTYRLGKDREASLRAIQHHNENILLTGHFCGGGSSDSPLISAELLPATQDAAPAPERAFLAACNGPGEDVTPLEWLSALLSELRETRLPSIEETEDRAHHLFTAMEDPEAMWTAYHACERLLLDLRAACDRAQGKPLPGVPARPDYGAEALDLLTTFVSCWSQDAPIHPTSNYHNQAEALLKKAGKR